MLNKTVVKFSVESVVISERCAGMDAYDKVISYPIMVIMFLEVVLVAYIGHTVKLFPSMFISVSIHVCYDVYFGVRIRRWLTSV